MRSFRFRTFWAMLFVVMFSVSATIAHSQDIFMSDETGNEGDTITLSVSVNNAPNAVASFGAEVVFDNNRLDFQNEDLTGTLIEGFVYVGANEATPGVITVGGLDLSGGFAAGSTGTLMKLIFTVKTGACSSPGASPFTLQNLVDDLSGWTTGVGSFSCPTICTPGDTQACNTGLLGICAAGTETCDGTGQWGSCVQDNQVDTEICDGLDNNCDGNVDEGVTNTYYRDVDGDGYGDANNTTEDCTLPSGYVADNTDCDDSNPNIHPGATEVCDGVDNNCDGNVDEGNVCTQCTDNDGDNYSVEGGDCGLIDCNDNDASINPGATEICDRTDNNCDGNVDEGVTNTYYRDVDTDGYGNPNNSVERCNMPPGFVEDNTDCNDADAAIHPGATEVCDGVDNNCDGNVDEGNVCTQCTDNDEDNYSVEGGDCGPVDCNDNDASINPGATEICDGVDNNCDGNVDEGNVCSDNIYLLDVTGVEGDTVIVSILINNAPNAVDSFGTEVAFDNNRLDFQGKDLTGTLVEGFVYADANEATPGVITVGGLDVSGGFAAGSTGTLMKLNFLVKTGACSSPGASPFTLQNLVDDFSGWTTGDGSFSCADMPICTPDDTQACDTGLPGICTAGTQTCNGTGQWGGCVQDNQPGAEVCDGVDNNCDGNVDEGVTNTYYRDTDGDGYGDASNTTEDCTIPSGYVADNTDCDDTDPTINPGATEICDDIDNNCDGNVDEGFIDTDNDGTADCIDNDDDGDGFDDLSDNCPLINNDQTDTDLDEVGDNCDNCPDDVNTDQSDLDDDDIGDVCDFEDTMLTTAGPDVALDFSDINSTLGVSITFDEITSDGYTNVTSGSSGPALPSGFVLLGNFYDIETTAIFSGTVEVCFSYDDSGLTDAEEQNLSLFHYENGVMVDVTTFLDTVNNVICGEVTGFSEFAVGSIGVADTDTGAGTSVASDDGHDDDDDWYKCFIATAAYGTPMAKEVKILCRFRDAYLLTNSFGQKFVSLYYEYSPSIANQIKNNSYMKATVRNMLKPVVWLAQKFIAEDDNKKNHQPTNPKTDGIRR